MAQSQDKQAADAADSSAFLRLDKWLFHARFCKSRQVAATLCSGGQLRIGGTTVSKPHYKLRVGDVLTFPLGPYIRVVKVLALGTRRGPAAEARTLYEDLNPIEQQTPVIKPGSKTAKSASRDTGTGRPTKRDRRATDKLRGL